MAERPALSARPAEGSRMHLLMEKLGQHTITLEECYELHAWIKAVYSGQTPVPSDTAMLAFYILTLIERRIIDLRGHL